MGTRITTRLSVAGIRQAQKQLLAYRNDMIAKCEKFVRVLANKGILVAEDNLAGTEENPGGYGNYITFEVKTEPERYGVKGILVATNTGIIKSEWRLADGSTRTADVSPLLMAEFGSGLRANNVRAGEFGMGTGTFPEQTHAEDPEGWWYMDTNDEWHHSRGVTPTMPMGKAYAEILDQIDTVAKEVFGT